MTEDNQPDNPDGKVIFYGETHKLEWMSCCICGKATLFLHYHDGGIYGGKVIEPTEEEKQAFLVRLNTSHITCGPREKPDGEEE